jgi:DNA-binding protein YbaB
MGDTVEALGYKADVPSRVKEAVHDKVDTVKGTIGGVVDGVKDALSGAKQTVSDKVGDVTSSVTSNVSEGVGGIAGKIPSGADVKGAAQRGVGIVAENPLGLALGALAVGFLAGLLTPVTDYEREKVGPIRDDLLERAQTVGGDVIEHGKQVLQDTVQGAVQSAQQSAQTHSQQVLSEATGAAQHRYGVLLDDAERDTLEPGAPGTASP